MDLSSELDSVTINRIAQKDTLAAKFVEKYAKGNSAWDVSIDDSDSWPFSEKEWETFSNIKDNGLLSDQQIFDSLKVEHKHSFTQHTIKQVIRVYRSDKEYLFAYVLKNFSLMMQYSIYLMIFVNKSDVSRLYHLSLFHCINKLD